MKKQYRISIDIELYERLKEISTRLEIPMANLLKLCNKINLKNVKVEDYGKKNKQLYYYSDSYKIEKYNINYKIAKFLDLFDTYFN